MNTTPAGELRDAIEGLYDTFARYKLAAHVPGCDHCTSDADHAAIHAAPLRRLTVEHLSRYAFKAMTTWGSADDFRHFLPRVFELLAAGAFRLSAVDPEVVLGKLDYGKWRKWPAVEQEAVERYMRASWRSVLSTYPHPVEADSLLCAIGQAVDDVSPYLAAWDVAGSRAAACHFATFAYYNTPHGGRRHTRWQLSNAWWPARPVPAEQVRAWVLHPDRASELEAAFHAFADADAETLCLLSDGFTHLGSIRAAA